MKLVISQPMYFPWAGIFEQMRLADCFVHYDDVQLPQGRSFSTRVQVKSSQGPMWLSVPVVRRVGQNIIEARVDDGQKWRQRHLATLSQLYSKAPFKQDMLELAHTVLNTTTDNLCEINILSIELCAKYLGISGSIERSSRLGVAGASSQRLCDICKHLGASEYITGHGAKNYLDHDLFERSLVSVQYMNYQRSCYPQLHGPFDPHLTILDLIANVGPSALTYLNSPTTGWRSFVSSQSTG